MVTATGYGREQRRSSGARRRWTGCFPIAPISSPTTPYSPRTACTSRTWVVRSQRPSCRTAGCRSAAFPGSSRAGRQRLRGWWRLMGSGGSESVARDEEFLKMTDIPDLSANQLHRLIAQRELSPVELVEACLQRVERFNGVLNAVVTLSEHALDDARALEREVQQGKVRPLCGL